MAGDGDDGDGDGVGGGGGGYTLMMTQCDGFACVYVRVCVRANGTQAHCSTARVQRISTGAFSIRLKITMQHNDML